MRIGSAFDAHRLVKGRPLVIGGVTIPYRKGLQGHSDADVLLHALCDALLGALALNDIGVHFPDSDERYKGIASTELLRMVGEMSRKEGYVIGNLDATVIAQEPRLIGYIDRMRTCISGVLDCDKSRVSVKATTTEGMGFCGREEGIAAMAVALLEKK
jgi:2-C-methyl-D-erythritol 2,4-cyclodiphosphate synthase